MKCNHCGTEVESDVTICPNCGDDIPSKENSLENDLKEYIGKNDTYYLKKWNLNENGEPEKQISINWAAFFLTFFWLGYRKMYGTIFIIIGAYFVLDMITFLTGIEQPATIGLIVGVMMGLWGNYLYFNRAKKAIEKKKQMGENEIDWKKGGGTSKLGVFLSIGIIVVYIIISYFIIAPLFIDNSEIVFGNGEVNGEIVELTEEFSPMDDMHVGIYFDDDDGRLITVVLEKEDGDDYIELDNWEEDVPEGWPGIIYEWNVPSEEGKYQLTVFEENEVITEGTFEVVD